MKHHDEDEMMNGWSHRPYTNMDEYKTDYDRIKEKRLMKRLKKENPEAYKILINKNMQEKRYQRQYGLTLEQVNEQGEFQNWLCCICNINIFDNFHIDHDHETGNFRGLLCPHCNFGLGHFRDSIEILENAIDYLKESHE